VERQRHQRVNALPPPPDPPFDIDRMEPIEAPPRAIWRDDFEEFGPDRWTDSELDLGDARRLVLDAPDPFPGEEWAVSGAN